MAGRPITGLGASSMSGLWGVAAPVGHHLSAMTSEATVQATSRQLNNIKWLIYVRNGLIFNFISRVEGMKISRNS